MSLNPFVIRPFDTGLRRTINGASLVPNPGNKKRPKSGFYFSGNITLGEDKNTEDEGVPVLKWVATAPLQVLTLDAVGVTVTWPDDEDNNFFEVDRDTHSETIASEEDPSVSIDVDVIDKIAVKNGSGKRVLTYNYGSGGGV